MHQTSYSIKILKIVFAEQWIEQWILERPRATVSASAIPSYLARRHTAGQILFKSHSLRMAPSVDFAGNANTTVHTCIERVSRGAVCVFVFLVERPPVRQTPGCAANRWRSHLEFVSRDLSIGRSATAGGGRVTRSLGLRKHHHVASSSRARGQVVDDLRRAHSRARSLFC